MMQRDFTLGVEEEFHVVDPATRALVPDGPDVLEHVTKQAHTADPARVQAELHQSQVETATPVCATLGDVRRELVALRGAVVSAAAQADRRVVAAGTVPLVNWAAQRITDDPRYKALATDFEQLAREQLITGTHVHVGITDPERVVAVMNRVLIWLPTLLALSVSSPFWSGMDTGYASYRSMVWRRWPNSGFPQQFASRDAYDRVSRALVSSGTVSDIRMLYWDVRPSTRFPTLEMRVADACTTVDEAVLQAGLTLGIVRTCHAQAEGDEPLPPVRRELLDAAKWRAARYGLDGRLLDPTSGELLPGETAVDDLLEFVRPALEDAGEWEEVAHLAKQTLGRGTSASRQRRAYRRRGQLEDVVDLVAAETAGPS